jgi:hypothetical protein
MRSFASRRRRALLRLFSLCLAIVILQSSSPAQTSPPAGARGRDAAAVTPIAASAAVLIVDPGGNAAADSDAQLQRRLNTHAVTIASEQHLHKVIAKAAGETRKTHWFKESDNPIERADWLREHLRVAVLPGTALIQISLDDLADPIDRKAIVEDICSTYLEGQRSERTNQLLDRTMMLNNVRIKNEARLKDLRAEMREKQAKLNLEGGGVGGIGRTAVKDMELTKFLEVQIDAQLRIAKAHAIVDALTQGKESPQIDETVQRMAPYLHNDRDQLHQLQTTRDQLAEQTGADNPKVKDLTQRLERMRAAYKTQSEEAHTRARNQLIEEARQDAASAEAVLKALVARVQALKEDLGDLTNATIQYAALQKEEKAVADQVRSTREQVEQIMALISSASAVEISWHLHPEVTPPR